MATKVTKIIHLDSANYKTGSNNSTNNQPVLQIDSHYDFSKCKHAKLRLINYDIPNSFFQVNSVLGNNSFSMSEDDGASTYTVTITSGWYTFSSFVTELQTQITASLVTVTAVTVTYNSINGFVTITSDGVTNIKLNLSGNAGFAALIGMAASNQAFANAQTSIYPINLLPVRYVWLRIPELKQLTQDSTTWSSSGEEAMMFMIPTVGDFGDTNVMRSNDDRQYESSIQGTLPKFLTMECRDKDGNLVDFNNVPWSVTFEVCFYQ